MQDYAVCFMPVLAGMFALAEYLYIPNLSGNISTSTYIYFLGVLTAAAGAFFVASIFWRKAFYRLRYKAPFFAFVFVLLAAYDYITLNTGRLVLP